MARRHQYFVYILTNERHTVLYTGVTNHIRRRLTEHRSGRGSAFCQKYNVSKLVYFETFGDVHRAIAREKQLKGGSRQQKLDLIAAQNPSWRDVAGELALL